MPSQKAKENRRLLVKERRKERRLDDMATRDLVPGHIDLSESEREDIHGTEALVFKEARNDFRVIAMPFMNRRAQRTTHEQERMQLHTEMNLAFDALSHEGREIFFKKHRDPNSLFATLLRDAELHLPPRTTYNIIQQGLALRPASALPLKNVDINQQLAPRGRVASFPQAASAQRIDAVPKIPADLQATLSLELAMITKFLTKMSSSELDQVKVVIGQEERRRRLEPDRQKRPGTPLTKPHDKVSRLDAYDADLAPTAILGLEDFGGHIVPEWRDESGAAVKEEEVIVKEEGEL